VGGGRGKKGRNTKGLCPLLCHLEAKKGEGDKQKKRAYTKEKEGEVGRSLQV